MEKIKCKYCGKEYSKKGIGTHIWRSHGEGKFHNSNKGYIKGTRTAWNKGLTKADPRVAKYGNTISEIQRQKVKDGKWVPSVMSKEARKRQSKRMSEHNPGGRSKWYEVNGKKVQGTWERDIALKLSEMNIEWERCKPIEYLIDNETKNYTPDFYLPTENIYLEVKGYWWGNDKQKMDNVIKQHPDKKIFIIEEKEFNQILKGELVW